MNVKKFIKEKILNSDANNYAKRIYLTSLLNNAICRCAAAATTRKIDNNLPQTWEFSGFSQNGEDGIIDFLISSLNNSNKYFIEIGSGNGLENNTSYLAHIKKFAGLQIEGDTNAYNDANLTKPWLIENVNCFVDSTSVMKILDKALYKNPDVFSIDIDGMDYYITKLLLENGLRPKIIVVEYNSAFGSERSITIPYNAGFDMYKTDYPFLYYGVSLNGWKKILSEYNYTFVTVETNGVNAFFIQADEFLDKFLDNVKNIAFKENVHQLRSFRKDCIGQFELIASLPFVEI